MIWVIKVILFILPAYFANSLPVLLGGGKPMDFGMNFMDGKRILGDGKTWRGFATGVGIAWLIGCIYSLYLPDWLAFYDDSFSYVFLGLISGFGTMLGDALGSFVKRRLHFSRGAPSFLIDQLPFLYLTLLFLWLYDLSIVSWFDIFWLTVLTYLVHRIANVIANRFGWKKVSW